MKMIKNSLIFFVLLFSFSSFAQENDFQLWNSVSVKKKINKKHSLDLKYGLRFRENGSIVAKNFIDIRTRYKLHKKWSVALGYRNINEWSKYSQLVKKNRFYFDSYIQRRSKDIILILGVELYFKEKSHITRLLDKEFGYHIIFVRQN